MRLDRFLHEAGCGTRSEIQRLIRAGKVQVDGVRAEDRAAHLPAGAQVMLLGKPVTLRGPRVVAFHKPAGLVTATRDHLPTIYSALPFGPDELLPVGRLDRETEGLLLLTNDGVLLHRLTDPRRHVEKEYVAFTSSPLGADAVARLLSPLDIGRDETTRPAVAAELRSDGALRLVITEGKYRQVRRMVTAVGSEVVRLIRTRIGALSLGDQPLGSVRDLAPDEENALRRATGLLAD